MGLCLLLLLISIMVAIQFDEKEYVCLVSNHFYTVAKAGEHANSKHDLFCKHQLIEKKYP